MRRSFKFVVPGLLPATCWIPEREVAMKSEAVAMSKLIVFVIVSLVFLAACGGTSSTVNPAPAPPPTFAPAPTINDLYPSCAPAGEQLVDSVDNQLTVISNDTSNNFVAGSVVRWN